MWYFIIREYCSAIKNNEVLIHATSWMNLKNMLIKNISHKRPHKQMSRINKCTETESKLKFAWGWEIWRGNEEWIWDFFWGDENVLTLIVVIVVYTENHWDVHLKLVNFMICNYISINVIAKYKCQEKEALHPRPAATSLSPSLLCPSVELPLSHSP